MTKAEQKRGGKDFHLRTKRIQKGGPIDQGMYKLIITKRI